LKRLLPLGRKLKRRTISKGKESKNNFRYFYAIFGYTSDLSINGWIENEYSRIDLIRSENNYKENPIDRIYVADRGIIMPSTGTGREESAHSGEALMEFFIHSVNFCLREDSRRPPVDYVNYTRSSGHSWKNLRLKCKIHPTEQG
jgi:hypothetical protein